MANPTPPIDDLQALLMLVVADELPPAQRQAALLRIGGERSLQARLQALQDAQAALHAGLGALDAATPLPLSAAAAVRQFREAAAGKREREIARPAVPAVANRLRLQWWMYPSVAAAILLVSMMTWWGWHNQDVVTNGQTPVAQTPTGPGFGNPSGNPSGDAPAQPPADTLASTPANGSASVPPPMAIAIPAPPMAVAPAPSEGSAIAAESDDLAGVSGVADAEQQANTLQRRSDPSTITASIFLNDPGAPVE